MYVDRCKHLKLHIDGIIKHYKTSLTTISSMLMIFTVITQDMLLIKTFYKPCTRTNIGKQSVSSIVVDLWQDLSTSLKNLNTFTFPGKVKEYLLKTQFSNLPI